MQAIFRVAQSVANLILWCEAPVTVEMHRLTIGLCVPATAPDAPGVNELEFWGHGRDGW